MTADPLNQARQLFERGRSRDAHDVLAAAMAAGLNDAAAHKLMGLILLPLGDIAGCAEHLRLAARLSPQDGAAQFALASIANRLGDEAEAEAATRKAIRLGMDDIHSYVLLGRIFGKQGRFDEAEAAWRKAVRHDPNSVQAQRELAHLVWMRTGDVAQARVELDTAPQNHDIVAVTVRLLQDAGEERAAYDLAAAGADRDPSLSVVAARAALKFDPHESERWLKAAPRQVTPVARAHAEIEVSLALGRIEEAVLRAEALHRARPQDQHGTALLATAWRLAGDPRYHQLYDYDRVVKSYRIQPPDRWVTLDSYLSDLAAALDAVHGPLTHPVGQSVRHGSQTTRALEDYPDPAIKALFRAIAAPIGDYIAGSGGERPFKIASAWSVRLNSGGFHTNHIHAEGWLSSAFYVRVPQGVRGQEGWLKFGEPGPPSSPPLEADHLVKPEPGLLVLFPSYVWHGTVAFSAPQQRLTCAFDIVPKASQSPVSASFA